MRFGDTIILTIMKEIQDSYREKFGKEISFEDIYEIISIGQMKFTSLCIENKIDVHWKNFGTFAVSVFKQKKEKYYKEYLLEGLDKDIAKMRAKEKITEEYDKWFESQQTNGDANYFKELIRKQWNK
jgi:hypothetical protein